MAQAFLVEVVLTFVFVIAVLGVPFKLAPLVGAALAALVYKYLSEEA